MATVRLFLSAVSAEFADYRDALRHDLTRPNVRVAIQEDFIVTGGETLSMLDDYIAACDAVIHLVGDLTGAPAQALSLEAIRARYPDLDERLPPLQAVLAAAESPEHPLSYTQWEAWLALYHRKKLIIAQPQATAPRDPRFRPDTVQRAAQEAHLERLAAVECYPGIHFANVDRLSVDLLAAAGQPRMPRNLPFASLGELFKGRAAAMQQLAARLGAVPAKPQPAVARAINGTPGVGKTRLAIEYALANAERYRALLFVAADSPSALLANLAALSQPAVLDLPEQHDSERQRQRAAVLRWLAGHPGWLLLIDNIDNEDAARAVEELLPQLQGGHVLLTSRLAQWSGDLALPALHELSPAAAVDFLRARTQGQRRTAGDETAAARRLAGELGHLALALEQAAAYIGTRRLSFAQYLVEWQTRRPAVLAWCNARLMRYPLSVAVTWQTSVAQLGADARRLLAMLAWLAPAPIPETLLDEPLPADGGTAFDGPAALAELAAYSLASREDERPFFSVHRLLQEVGRQEQRAGCADAAPAALRTVWVWLADACRGNPQDVRDWPRLDPLAAHAVTVAAYTDEAVFAEYAELVAPTAKLLSQTGLLFYFQARHADAEPLLRRALAIDAASYGEAHPRVAIGLNNLAQLLQATNRLSEAEPLMRRALAIDEASYGDAHPRVAIGLNNLAQLLQATNRLSEAEPLLRRALAIDEASYGDAHPDVAIDLNNLAALLQATKRLSEAEPLMRRALAIDKASYGDAHPKVATRLNNLAQLLQVTNRLSEAEPLMQRALSIDEASYGDAHPRVARDLNNLAQLLQDTNRLSEAEPLMRRALVIDEASYGDTHPDVAIDLNNLARLLQATNRLSEAEPLLRRALAIFLDSLGREHPNTLTVQENYVFLLQELHAADDTDDDPPTLPTPLP